MSAHNLGISNIQIDMDSKFYWINNIDFLSPYKIVLRRVEQGYNPIP